jgi:hypothetical protein
MSCDPETKKAEKYQSARGVVIAAAGKRETSKF